MHLISEKHSVFEKETPFDRFWLNYPKNENEIVNFEKHKSKKLIWYKKYKKYKKNKKNKETGNFLTQSNTLGNLKFLYFRTKTTSEG